MSNINNSEPLSTYLVWKITRTLLLIRWKEQPPPKTIFISRHELHNFMKNSEQKSLQDRFNLLRWEVITRVDPSDMVDFTKRYNNFCTQYKIRWQKCHRTDQVFFYKITRIGLMLQFPLMPHQHKHKKEVGMISNLMSVQKKLKERNVKI